MGCRSSAPREPQQDAPSPAPAATRRNTTGAQRESAGGGARQAGRNQQASFAASVVGWDKDFPEMTMAQLQNRRNEFWDTRVQGRAEMWQALRVAVESGDDSTSSAILESAGLQPFDIDAAERFFTYDQKGFKYEVPLYCLYTPSNLMRDPPPAAAATAKSQAPLQVQVAPSSARSQQHSTVNDEAKSAEPQSHAGAAQGAAPVGGGTGKSLKFTIRFSNGLPDYPLDARSSTSISALKSLICARHPALHPLHDSLRLYYLGKWMSQPQWTLGEIGMKKEMVLQCFIPGVARKAE